MKHTQTTSKRKRKRINQQSTTLREKIDESRFIQTGISGFDALVDKGIPRGSSVLISGGPGVGKTLFCLQMLSYSAKIGKKCLYLSLEEPESRLKEHMDDFGWNWREFERKGLLKITQKQPFVFTMYLEAMLAHAQGELLIDLNEILTIIPESFKPDIIILDSVSAIATTFNMQELGYRIFIEQLFRYFYSLDITSFFVGEIPRLSISQPVNVVEEFLADGVIMLYSLAHRNFREKAIEVLKMRGVYHQKKIVPLQIIPKQGIIIYPDQEIFGELEEK